MGSGVGQSECAGNTSGDFEFLFTNYASRTANHAWLRPRSVYGTYGYGNNNRGQVTGAYVDGNFSLGTRSSTTGACIPPSMALRDDSDRTGFDLNDRGQVVGQYVDSDFNQPGFLYLQGHLHHPQPSRCRPLPAPRRRALTTAGRSSATSRTPRSPLTGSCTRTGSTPPSTPRRGRHRPVGDQRARADQRVLRRREFRFARLRAEPLTWRRLRSVYPAFPCPASGACTTGAINTVFIVRT